MLWCSVETYKCALRRSVDNVSHFENKLQMSKFAECSPLLMLSKSLEAWAGGCEYPSSVRAFHIVASRYSYILKLYIIGYIITLLKLIHEYS